MCSSFQRGETITNDFLSFYPQETIKENFEKVDAKRMKIFLCIRSHNLENCKLYQQIFKAVIED